MKTRRIIFVLSVVLILLSIIGISCSQQESALQEAQEQNQSDLIKTGKDFAFTHNECLSHILKDLSKIKTRTTFSNTEELRNIIIKSANNYIAMNNENKHKIENADFKITIEEIKNSISVRELFYIEKAISIKDKESVSTLITKVESDNDIDEDKKLAIICFITTFNASTEYWNKYLGEWFQLIDKPQTRASIENIALADAWWGFQGMLMSGLNPIAGGGMAAVASAGTAIWGKAEATPEEEQTSSTEEITESSTTEQPL